MHRVPHLDVPTRRRPTVFISVPEATGRQLNDLAAELGRPPAEVLQIALDLLSLTRAEASRGHVLAIATRDGVVLKEVAVRS